MRHDRCSEMKDDDEHLKESRVSGIKLLSLQIKQLLNLGIRERHPAQT